MKKSELAEHPFGAPHEAGERRQGAVSESAPAMLKELNAVLADLQAARGELHEKDAALAAVRAELDGQREQLRELAEHVRKDERFRVVAESAPCALVMVDQAGEIVFVNAQAEALCGYRRDELMGRTIELLLP